MIDVGQALKNNILTFTVIAILAVGLAFVSGLSLKSEIYSLAIPMGIFSIMVCAVGVWKWNQILEQIKLLMWAKAKEKKFNESGPEDK